MRIVITGGFGLVGGRLAEHLQRQGHQLVVGSRQPQGEPDWLPRVEAAVTDWQDEETLRQLCQGAELVIHAAGMNAANCASDPVAALAFNGVATARLVAAAAAAGVRRFLYLSSAHVYSAPLAGVISEESCPRNLHPYATSHRAGEDAVLYAAGRGMIDGAVLRMSNSYGRPTHPWVDCWMLLLNDLCRQALVNGTLRLHSGGGQVRDFIPLSAVCRIVEQLVLAESPLPRRVFNVASGRAHTLLEMAQMIQARCRQVLGFLPPLQAPAGGAGGEGLAIERRALEELGVRFELCHEAEIDELLVACAGWFTRGETV